MGSRTYAADLSINPPLSRRGESQDSTQVCRLRVGKVAENLFVAHTAGHVVQCVDEADVRATNTGLAAASGVTVMWSSNHIKGT